MKRKILLSILSTLIISSIFISCSKGEENASNTENTSVETTVEDVEDDEKESDNEAKETTNTENEDATNEVDKTKTDTETASEQNKNLSYEAKTVEYDGGKIDIPVDWIEEEFSSLKVYIFPDNEGSANILSTAIPGEYSEEFSSTYIDSIIKTLNLDANSVKTGSLELNGVTITYMEYHQGVTYVYQPFVFVNDRLHVLTTGSETQEYLDENRDLFNEIITTVR